MILVFYVLFIFRRFRHHTSGLVYLVYTRFTVFAGFSIVYTYYIFKAPALSFIGNGFLILSSSLFIYFLTKQLKKPYRTNLHLGLFTLYILLFSYSVMKLQLDYTGSVITAFIAVIQFTVFLIDYYKGSRSYYCFIAALLIPFTLIHLSRVMAYLKTPSSISNPLDGNLVSALALISFMLLDMVITLGINTQIHKRNLFKNL